MNKSYLNIISAQDLRDNSHPHIFFFWVEFLRNTGWKHRPYICEVQCVYLIDEKMIAS